MVNFDRCVYTCEHRIALRFCIETIVKDKQLRAALLNRAKYHDVDKLFLFQVTDTKSASNLHRKLSTHHMTNNIPKQHLDLAEAVLDFECAGYTKPDKPLNAYDTIHTWYDKYRHLLLPEAERLGIARSYQNKPDDPAWQAYRRQFPEITESYIQAEIDKWKAEKPLTLAHISTYIK